MSYKLPVIDQTQSPDRFVDQDMGLRYHWGLGIGHTYSHSVEYNDAGGHLSQPGIQSN